MIQEVDIITRSREFAHRALNGKTTKVSKDDYCLFLISNFLLLKESIIKKNYKNKTIYFDVERNKKYLPVIKKIVDYVKGHGKLETGTKLKAVMIPDSYNSDVDLVEYIKAFHKIRDSLAHGKYVVRPVLGMITINNKENDYEVKCNLPIEFLEMFGYIDSSRKSKETFEKYVKKQREEYEYNYKYFYNFYDPKTTSINNNDYYSFNNKFKTFASHSYPDIDNVITLMNTFASTLEKTKYDKEKIKEYRDLLHQTINKIYECNIPKTTKKKVLKGLKNVLLLYDNRDDKKLKLPDETIIARTAATLIEMSRLLRTKKDGKEILRVVSVYNYMQTFLSFEMGRIGTISDEQEEMILGSLRMRNLNYSFMNSKSYSVIFRRVNRLVKEYTAELNKKIKEYEHRPTIGGRDSINRTLESFYKNLLLVLSQRNKIIVGSIRNAIDHGNVSVADGEMKLKNVSYKDNGTKEKKFTCSGSLESFFDLITHLDARKPSEGFNFDDALLETDGLISDGLKASLNEVLSRIRSINEKYLLEDVRQVALKR